MIRKENEQNYARNVKLAVFWTEISPENKKNSCRSISAKPTSIKKGKDIPKLPENYKKLYQYF